MSFSTCIGNWASDAWHPWLEAHAAYKGGHLPFSGSYMEQPNKVIEVFQVIEAWQISVHNEALKEQKEKQARNDRRARGR